MIQKLRKIQSDINVNLVKYDSLLLEKSFLEIDSSESLEIDSLISDIRSYIFSLRLHRDVLLSSINPLSHCSPLGC